MGNVINLSENAIKSFYLSHGDTATLIITILDVDTNSNLDLTGSTIKLSIFQWGNSTTAKTTLTATIDGDEATFTFNSTFWSKLFHQDYDYQIWRAIGDENKKIASGQFYTTANPNNGLTESVDDTVYVIRVHGVGLTGPQGDNGLPLRMETIYVEDGTTVITDDKLIGSQLFPMIWFEQSGIRYTANGITWDGDGGVLDFSAYGALPAGYLDFIIKD